MEAFFDVPKRKQIVYDAHNKFKSEFYKLSGESNDKRKFLIDFIRMTLNYINNDPQYFDKNCKMTINELGLRFIDSLRDGSLDVANLENVFSMCYKFILECQISTSESLNPEALAALERVPSFDYGVAASQVKYADKQMAINLIQYYIHHPKLVELKELPNVINEANSQHVAIEKAMSERESRVQELADKLVSYETAFNFVGLYAGFKNMRAGKVVERHINFICLLALGLLLLVPFALKLFYMFQGRAVVEIDAVGLATLAGLEILLLYFFKLALQNFKSIKSQLLQIDLRMTLCQFVQSYADYSKDVRSNNSSVLERFEQVVFSGIVNDDSAIPSTFDGLDKVAELLGKFRK